MKKGKLFPFVFRYFNIFPIEQHETDGHKKPAAVSRVQPELHKQIEASCGDSEPPRKDACTSTEAYEELLNRRQQEEGRYRRSDDEAEVRERILQKTLDEELDISNRKHHRFANKPDITVRRHHRFDEDFDLDRRYHRPDYDPEVNEEMDSRFRYESDYDKKPLRFFNAERYLNFIFYFFTLLNLIHRYR